MAYLLLFDRVFSELLEEILTHNFFRYRSWFEVFLCLLIEDGERTVLTHYSCCWRPLRQHSTCTLQLLFGSSLKAYYLHITVAVGGHSKRKVLIHFSGCWGLFESMEFYIIIAVGEPFASRVLTHCSFFESPSMKLRRVVTHFSGC